MTVRRGLLLVVIGLAGLAGCFLRPPAPPAPAPRPAVTEARPPAGAALGRWIRVEKMERRLTLFDDTEPIRTYSVVLGADPFAAKLHEGDNRTPEGEYHIAAKYPHREWSRFLLLDYPTPMNRKLHAWSRQIGLLPNGRHGTPGVGGQVGIHGTVNDAINRAGRNWTRGCISLENRDVEELYSLVDVGTRVVIEK
jgi:lipoprotein-anchoring transpeptidase ErfK/SrfK